MNLGLSSNNPHNWRKLIIWRKSRSTRAIIRAPTIQTKSSSLLSLAMQKGKQTLEDNFPRTRFATEILGLSNLVFIFKNLGWPFLASNEWGLQLLQVRQMYRCIPISHYFVNKYVYQQQHTSNPTSQFTNNMSRLGNIPNPHISLCVQPNFFFPNK